MSNESAKTGPCEKELNLYQRINEVRRRINYIQQDKEVDTGKGKYKAVTHDAVTGQVRQHLIDCGIVVVPTLVTSSVAVPPPKADGSASPMIRYEATYDFAVFNADDPSQTLTIRIEAHAMDNQDKAPGKAISYAKKYAVLKLFEIETGEDDESRWADKGEFPLQKYIDMLDVASDDREALQMAYELGRQAAMEWPDAPAFKILKEATTKRLAAIDAKVKK